MNCMGISTTNLSMKIKFLCDLILAVIVQHYFPRVIVQSKFKYGIL